jgi:hypothetical protein
MMSFASMMPSYSNSAIATAGPRNLTTRRPGFFGRELRHLPLTPSKKSPTEIVEDRHDRGSTIVTSEAAR